MVWEKMDATGNKHLILVFYKQKTAQEIEASYDKTAHLKKEAA